MTFNIKTLGCKVNTYESEYIYSLFIKKGYVFSEENADIYVVNTCTVTNQSDRKSRQVIHSIRRDHPKSIIIVCGCYVQNCYHTNKLDEIDADIILGNKDKSKILDYLEDYLKNRNKITYFYDMNKIEFEDMEIKHAHNRTRAYIKIEDGCENFCTYCIIPYVRGCVRSKKHEKVIEEARTLVNHGHKEIVLTGIHTGHYVDGDYDFADLLNDLSKIEGLIRIRISSIEINELNEKVLEVIKNNDNIVPHFHVPLQSGCDKTLRLMNRRYNKEFFKSKLEEIRSIKPNVSFTTDVIVGFPTETDEMHKESLEFINECKFTRIHAFPYSDRYGTSASKMNGKVDGNIKKQRVRELIELSNKLEKEFNSKFINKTLPVLFEEEKDGFFIGHTPNFIKIKTKGNYKINEIYDVTLTEENIVNGE